MHVLVFYYDAVPTQVVDRARRIYLLANFRKIPHFTLYMHYKKMYIVAKIR